MFAAAAGFLYAMKYPQLNQTASSIWVLLGLKAFVAAVVGGIGNVRGAMLGGVVIGLIEFFGVAYLSSNYRDVYVFLVLILVLLLRPEGAWIGHVAHGMSRSDAKEIGEMLDEGAAALIVIRSRLALRSRFARMSLRACAFCAASPPRNS